MYSLPLKSGGFRLGDELFWLVVGIGLYPSSCDIVSEKLPIKGVCAVIDA
jgi:hypothetical protein